MLTTAKSLGSVVRVSGLILLASVFLACGDDGGGAGGPGGGAGTAGGGQVTLAQVQAEVFTPSCALASCHVTTTEAGGLVLEEGQAYDELINVMPENPAAAGEGLVLVAPDMPGQSFLLRKLMASLDTDQYGLVMPVGAPSGLEADRLALVQAWIEAGAPQ